MRRGPLLEQMGTLTGICIPEDIPLPKTNDEELYSALLKELEDRADNFQIKLKNEEKIELHREILKQKGFEKNETAQKKRIPKKGEGLSTLLGTVHPFV